MSYLFLLTQDDPDGPKYDVAVGFVVRAKSPSAARRLAATKNGSEGKECWLDQKRSKCNVIYKDGPDKIIMRDFNPG
jgi:hypothetical protein